MANYSLGVADLGTEVDLSGLNAGIDKAEAAVKSGFDRAGSAIKTSLAVGLAGAGAALAGFAATSIHVAGDFEAGMNRFASVTGDAIEAAGFTLGDFQNKFLELGAVTQFSAAQAQDAAIALAKGGVAVADIMGGATQATLDMAAAGELELGPAAEIVAKQLGVWSEKGVTAANVADLLASAANASTVDIDELALGLANVGGSAKVMGVEYQDLVQTMALLAPGFSSAADAGTSYKTFLSRLLPQTKDQTAAMRSLGLVTEDGTSKFFDAQGSFIGMEQAAQLLHEATAGLSEEQKAMAFNTIFGADAVRAAAMIADAGAEGFNAMGQAMAGAGTASEQAAKRNQGFKFALDSLLGTVETIQIVVGSALLPILTDLINTVIIPGANAFLSFAQGILSANDPAQALISAIDGLIPGFTSFVDILATAWDAAQPVVDLLGANLEPILVGIGGALAAIVIPAIVSAVGAFLAAAAPIAALVAAGALLYSAWQTNFGGIQQLVLGSVVPALLSVWNIAQLLITGDFSGGIFGLSEDAPFINALFTARETLTSIWNAVMLLITGDFSGGIFGLAEDAPLISTLFTIRESIGQIISAFQDGGITAAIGVLLANIAAAAPLIGQQLLTWGQQLVSWITPYIPVLLAALGGVSLAIWTWIAAEAPQIGQQLLAWGQQFIAWVAPQIPILLAEAQSLATQFWTWISAQAAPLLAQLGQWANSLVAWIVPATTDFLAHWPGMLSQFLDWIASAAGPLLAQLGQWAMQFIAWIAPMIPPFLEGLAGVAAALLVFIAETAVVLVGKLIEWGAAMLGWIGTEVLPKLPGALSAIGTTINGWIAGALGWLAAEAGKLGAALIDGIVSGLGNIAGAIGSKITSGINSAISVVKSTFGIHSPSRYTAEHLGKPIMQGLGVGAEQEQGATQKKLADSLTDAVEKAADAISKGAEAFGLIDTVALPAREKLQAFVGALTDMTADFWHGAQTVLYALKDDTAAKFAELAGESADALGKSLDAFAKLDDFTRPNRQALLDLSYALRDVVADFWHRSQEVLYAMKDAYAPTFAKHVSDIAKAIGDAITGFAKLDEYQGFAGDKLNLLVADMGDAVNEFWSEAQDLLHVFKDDTTERFAELCSKAVGALKDALTVFRELSGPAVEVPEQSFAALGYALERTMQLMIQISGGIETTMLERATIFADAVGRVVAPIKAAIEAFNALRTYETIPAERMQALAANIYLAVWWMTEISKGAETTGLQAAVLFADAVTKLFTAIKAGTDAMAALAQYESVPPERMQAFANDFIVALGVMVQIADMGGVMLYKATEWAKQMKDTEAAIKSGISALDSINQAAEAMGHGAGTLPDSQYSDIGRMALGGGYGVGDAHKVPGFAEGVTDFEGGLAYVHQDELLVNLAPGTDVLPADLTSALFDPLPMLGANWTASASAMNTRRAETPPQEVKVTIDDRGSQLLRQLIRVEIDTYDRGTGTNASVRSWMD